MCTYDHGKFNHEVILHLREALAAAIEAGVTAEGAPALEGLMGRSLSAPFDENKPVPKSKSTNNTREAADQGVDEEEERIVMEAKRWIAEAIDGNDKGKAVVLEKGKRAMVEMIDEEEEEMIVNKARRSMIGVIGHDDKDDEGEVAVRKARRSMVGVIEDDDE